jgi:hypothetical protein
MNRRSDLEVGTGTGTRAERLRNLGSIPCKRRRFFCATKPIYELLYQHTHTVHLQKFTVRKTSLSMRTRL